MKNNSVDLDLELPDSSNSLNTDVTEIDWNTSTEAEIIHHLETANSPRIFYNAHTGRYQVCLDADLRLALEHLYKEENVADQLKFRRLSKQELQLLKFAKLNSNVSNPTKERLLIFPFSTLKSHLTVKNPKWLLLDRKLPGFLKVDFLDTWQTAAHLQTVLGHQTQRVFDILEVTADTKEWVNTLTFDN